MACVCVLIMYSLLSSYLEADLEAYFGQFGELEDVYIHGNRKAGDWVDRTTVSTVE